MELLIVLVMIGLMIAIAAPNINFGRYRVETAMQSLGTLLLAAQRSSVTAQHDVVVYLDTNNDLLRVHRDLNNNGAEDVGEIVRNYPLGDNVKFGMGSATAMPGWSGAQTTFANLRNGIPYITFHRNGSTSEAGGFYLTSANPGRNNTENSSTRALQLDRATGRTSWFRYTAAGWQRGF